MQDRFQYRNELLKKYIYIGLVVSLVISPVYYYLFIPYLAFTLNLFSIVMIYLIKKTKDTKKYIYNSRIFMFAITILFIVGLINGNQEINSTFFLLLFPIASFSIRGPKEGIIWSAFTLAILIILFKSFNLAYNPYSFLFFCIAYVMVSYLLYFYRYYEMSSYEKINKQLEKTIEERTAELKESNEKLKMLASTDALTKLYNRAKLDESLKNEINRTNRFQHELGIILLDIDHFKSVNDTYGHNVGDTLLIEISNILKKNTRDTDIVGRWGGEEFLIVCPETDKAGLLKLAENLRIAIKNANFTTVGEKTSSFGCSLYEKNENIKEFISKADKALYNAKEEGRNLVKYL